MAKYAVDSFGCGTKRSPCAHGADCWKSVLALLDLFNSLVYFEVKKCV